MYGKILVPLDGSKLAECTLPHVVGLAKAGAVREVVLLSVVDVPSSRMRDAIDDLHVGTERVDEARKYLGAIEIRLREEGINVAAEVKDGRDFQAITEFAGEKDVDLIVIASHGRSGLNKLLYGSVAMKVLHNSRVPVLLIRPQRRATDRSGVPFRSRPYRRRQRQMDGPT